MQSVNNRTQILREIAYYAWLLLTYIVINTLLGGLTLDPAGMHCPSWDDAFVSSSIWPHSMPSAVKCLPQHLNSTQRAWHCTPSCMPQSSTRHIGLWADWRTGVEWTYTRHMAFICLTILSACELTGSVSGPTQLGLESMQGDTDCTQAQTVQITLVTNSNTKATWYDSMLIPATSITNNNMQIYRVAHKNTHNLNEFIYTE